MAERSGERPDSQIGAQSRADRIVSFQHELATLEWERILTLDAAQRAAVDEYHHALLRDLAARFDVDLDLGEKGLSLGMRIAAFLGALALAASVLFFFFRIWGLISTAMQVTLLCAAPCVALVATAVVAARERGAYFTAMAASVAFACFVLNIAALGAIFNVTPSDTAFLLWGGFAFILAYAYGLRLLLAAAILSVGAYLSARVGEWSGCYWLSLGQRPESFIPVGLVTFLLPSVIRHRRFDDFPPIYRIFGLLWILLPVLVLGHWGMASYLRVDPAMIEVAYQTAGFVVSAGAVAIGIRWRWKEAVNVGTTFFVIFLYTKFFDWWWESMPKYLFFLAVGLTALLALLILKRLRLTVGAAQEVAP
ncbi:MAG: DUF2157 domain-containing protein [Nitrospirota bacterium]|jgi:uncharacterized membrane protein